MNECDAWTVSIVLRCDPDETRADAFLEGPAVEIEGSGYAPTRLIAPDGADATTIGKNVAAANALHELSQHLFDRARACRATTTTEHHP